MLKKLPQAVNGLWFTVGRNHKPATAVNCEPITNIQCHAALKSLNLKVKGFTLIELLVVITILGVLAAAVLVAINPGKRMGQARDSQRKAQLSEVKNALEAYNIINGSYPSTSDAWWGDPAGYGSHGYEGSNGYVPNLAPSEIKRLPQDPRGHTPGTTIDCGGVAGAGYLYRSNGTDYKLLAHCTPENYPPASENTFFDPQRPNWAYGVWSSDTSKSW